MEQLIYIEQNDKIEASKMAKNFTIEETKMRAYVNALGTELAIKYLAQENINISNVHNMHSICKIREEFDVADIMLPNINIDVRVVYDENLIFIPKTHFEYNLIPDVYLIFKMSDEATHVNFLGFVEPKLINKNNQNDNYYFIEKEKLSHPTDLKTFIENFNGNTTNSMTEEEIENAQRLAIAFIDDNITDADKKSLISMLTKSASLRENIAEFDNFEWISYHTATNQDFDNIEIENNDEEILLSSPEIIDEFDMFDKNDEFEQFDDDNEDTVFEEDTDEEVVEDSVDELPEETPLEEHLLDTDIVAETLHSIDVIQNGDPLDSFEDTLNEVEPIDDFNTTEDFETEHLESEENLTETIENDVIDELAPINDFDTAEDFEPESEGLEDLPETIENNTLEEGFAVDNFSKNLLDTELELENSDFEDDTEDYTEEISLDDGIQTEEDLEMFDEMLLNSNSEDNMSLESFKTINDLPSEENTLNETINEQSEAIHFDLPTDTEVTEPEAINSETASIIDSLLSDDILSTLPVENEEIVAVQNATEEVTSFENFENSNVETQQNDNSEESIFSFETIGDVIPVENTQNNNEDIETIRFDNLGTSDEYKITDESFASETNGAISFDNLAEKYTVNDELAEEYDTSQNVESIEALTLDSDVESTDDDTDFLNSLVTESEENSTENTQLDIDNNMIPTVFENSTIITNENVIPGEIIIDINQPISEESLDLENEKLGVLYNSGNEEGFNFNTTSSERGKKGILAAGLVVATLAGLFVFGSMNKSEDKVAENKKSNILEKNIPDSLDKNIPKLPEQKVPTEQKPTKAFTPVDPENIEKVVAKVPAKEKEELDKIVKEAKAELAKPKTNPIETPYLEVQKLTWSVPDYLSYNDQFKRYLQTAGKSLKLTLSSDLLLATEYAYSQEMSVDIILAKEGTFKDAKIGLSSGSSQIDGIVLRTVKETLSVVKAPAGLVVGPTVKLTLKIYL